MNRDPAIGAQAALAISGHLATLAEGMDAAAAAFPGGTSDWRGPAAEVLAGLLAARPERFRAVALACAGAGTALARQAPVELAVGLDQRAARLVDDSARQTAGSLLSLARSAPARPNLLHRWLGHLESWRSEVAIGTMESTEQLLDSAAKAGFLTAKPYDPRNFEELWIGGAALLGSARHPVELIKAVIDWDTWRSNPTRAVGHLLPDLLAAVAGGEVATGSRTATTMSRSRAALDIARARDAVRRQSSAAAGASSRQALIRRALTHPESPGPTAESPGLAAWRGEGGTRLSARQSADAEAFLSLSSASEPSITATLHEISQAADAELVGLPHRLKRVDSFKRKLATQYAVTGRPLPELLANAQDAVRYTVVLDDASYVRGVREVAALLERRGFHNERPPNNAWHSGRYRGINSHWLDPATGAAFELQFHTPASWRITVRTHPLYEEWRLPQTSPERKAELHDRIAGAYRQAPVPTGVESLTSTNFLPTSPPDAIEPPLNYTVHAAVAAGSGTELLEGGR